MESLAQAFPYLLGVSLAAVVVVLLIGVVSMLRGGDFNRRHGNLLMRLRVASQAVAVLLFLLFVVFIRA